MTINAINLLPVKTASCSVMGDYAIKKKMTVPYSKARRGDVVLYDFNHNGTSDHTGIIYRVEGSKIYVVEGNTSTSNDCNGGAVMKRVRTKSQVNYIIRPKYDKTVTADMIVKTALHQVGVKESPRNSNKVKYNTWFYGRVVQGDKYPWCCTFVCWCFAHVEAPELELTKPLGKYGLDIPKPTLKHGSKGKSVKQLQKFLNWYGCKKLKLDGKYGDNTEHQVKRFQKAEGIKTDGVYGSQSYKAAKAYKAEIKKPKPEQPAKDPDKKNAAAKLIAKMDLFAWKYGTPKKNYAYKTGRPRNACKEAMRSYGYDTKPEYSDCGNFVNTVVRKSGVDKHFTSLHAVKTPFPKKEDKFNIVISGRVPKVKELKAGDIIRYKKKGGDQHAMFYYGGGKICDAGHYNRFGNIRKNDFRYKRSNVKKNTIQVLRAKG